MPQPTPIHPTHHPTVAAVVLCGGRGTRMGGVDKPLQNFAGRPLIDAVIDRVRPQVDTGWISANRNLAIYQGSGWPVVADAQPEAFAGPLAGVRAVLNLVEHPFLLIVPGDTPHLPNDLCSRLVQAIAPGITAAVVHDGHRRQPLHCLVRTAEAKARRAELRSAQSAEDWHRLLDSVEVDFSDCADAFANLNRPEQFLSGSPEKLSSSEKLSSPED